MIRSSLRTLALLAFCCLAFTVSADTPTASVDLPEPDTIVAAESAPAHAAETIPADNAVDLLALFAEGGGQWLRTTSGGGHGNCYECDSHSECDNHCGPLGGACLRDLDETCDPGCPPGQICDRLEYCWCF